MALHNDRAYEKSQSSGSKNESDRTSSEANPWLGEEPNRVFRYLTVELNRDDGAGLLGLSTYRRGGGLCIHDIKDRGAAATWNSRCVLTYANDALKKGDLIIRVNGIGSGKSTHAHRLAHNMQTYWTDAMMNELWQQSRKDYLLVVNA